MKVTRPPLVFRPVHLDLESQDELTTLMAGLNSIANSNAYSPARRVLAQQLWEQLNKVDSV